MPISPSDEARQEKIAVTLGDPCGIGPEVTVRSLARLKSNKDSRFIVLGKAFLFNQIVKKLALRIRFEDIADIDDWHPKASSIACYFPEKFEATAAYGRPDKRMSVLAVRSIELAVKLAMRKKIDSIVTPPINKAAVKKAGFDIPGHTEYLAKLSGTKRFEMMLVGGPLRVVLVTRHMPLESVPKNISKNRVREVLEITDLELRRSFGIKRPKLVVCGLNPHAGESGNFGKQEIKIIAPAVKAARSKTDAEIAGPLSPDALFVDAYRGRYDAEICMYHDQGLIPLKMISRGGGVNVTLGLPFVRTSPDHGTAYDIAGRFTADAGSMVEALKLAALLSKNRKKFDKRTA